MSSQEEYPYTNYPEVATHAHLHRHGDAPEVVPQPHGHTQYYDPSKPDSAGGIPAGAIPPVGSPQQTVYSPDGSQYRYQQPAYAASAYPADASGSEYPEVVEEKQKAAPAKICGVKRTVFVTILATAILIIVAIAVGAGVGVSQSSKNSSHATSSSGSGSGSGSGDGNNDSGSGNGNGSGNGGNGTSSANDTATSGVSLLPQTQLATANFTDPYNNNNYMVIYQTNDLSIVMSSFNSSNDKWVVSTIANGTDGGILQGTALSMSTFWTGDTTSPVVNVYYQTDGSTTNVKALSYSSDNNISTTSVVSEDGWASVDTTDVSTMPGSKLASYGKQCDACNQFAYFYWQDSDGLYGIDDEGMGFQDASNVDNGTTPSTNTSLAMTFSGTTVGDEGAITRRSLELFYRSTTSSLVQLRIGNGMNVPNAIGRDIGPQTMITAFSTGFNQTDSEMPSSIGFHVLTIDPEGDDGVQLTYYKDAEWSQSSSEVEDLADCIDKAMMASNTGRRLYCVQSDGTDNGVEIVEYAWQGDPDDTTSYLDYGKIGVVHTTVS
ncbi:hypothetical protein F5Y18DRAFT_429974 [Xylariaceae sp. FL1019]|nr:hypothetical protein F5Y18DRAFT_429974 [Xylariaceae sp. FL1019]